MNTIINCIIPCALYITLHVLKIVYAIGKTPLYRHGSFASQEHIVYRRFIQKIKRSRDRILYLSLSNIDPRRWSYPVCRRSFIPFAYTVLVVCIYFMRQKLNLSLCHCRLQLILIVMCTHTYCNIRPVEECYKGTNHQQCGDKMKYHCLFDSDRNLVDFCKVPQWIGRGI